jgi:hypothetical protein
MIRFGTFNEVTNIEFRTKIGIPPNWYWCRSSERRVVVNLLMSVFGLFVPTQIQLAYEIGNYLFLSGLCKPGLDTNRSCKRIDKVTY